MYKSTIQIATAIVVMALAVVVVVITAVKIGGVSEYLVVIPITTLVGLLAVTAVSLAEE
jgi:hypothetical protein